MQAHKKSASVLKLVHTRAQHITVQPDETIASQRKVILLHSKFLGRTPSTEKEEEDGEDGEKKREKGENQEGKGSGQLAMMSSTRVIWENSRT